MPPLLPGIFSQFWIMRSLAEIEIHHHLSIIALKNKGFRGSEGVPGITEDHDYFKVMILQLM